MLIFIDDSGDPGFKTDRGSSPALVIALVCFQENIHAEQTARTLKTLRERLKLSQHHGFKFSKTKNEWRREYLETIAHEPFFVRAVSFKKSAIYSQNLIGNKDRFYRFAIKKALEGSKHILKNANIKIDGHGDRAFNTEFETYLRRELQAPDGKGLIKKLAFVKKSQNNELIQLADMCAGAINRCITYQDCTYRDLLGSKVQDLWQFK